MANFANKQKPWIYYYSAGGSGNQHFLSNTPHLYRASSFNVMHCAVLLESPI